MKENAEFSHVPVLAAECLERLSVRPGGTYVDATLGGGGHAELILKALGNGLLIGLDRDGDALSAASARLAGFDGVFRPVKTNFADLYEAAAGIAPGGADGILFDLGVSSYQLDTPERGFSYMENAPLDMRMDKTSGFSARDVVNGYGQGELARILSEYGEERFSNRIAAAIVRARDEKPLETTFELREVVVSAIPAAAARAEKQHPARRSFQAIRIEVNGELEAVRKGLAGAVRFLKPGGRLCVISFHSLEDRIVKKTFSALASGCECPPDFPVCICGKKPEIRLTDRKPVLPSEKEREENPRSRSAKLRCAEKL